MMRTVVVTGAGGPAGKALGRQLAALRAKGCELLSIGTDTRALVDANFAMTVQVPRADSAQYAPALRELVAQTRADVVIPTVSEELVRIAGIAHLLGEDERAPAVVVSTPAATTLCEDKLFTMWALEAAGVAVPKFAGGTEHGTARSALDAFGGPVIVKPRVSRGGRGVRLVEDPRDDWGGVDARSLIQSFAPGVEYAPQVYRSPRTGAVSIVVLEKTVLREGRVGNAVETRRLPAHEAADVAWLAASAVTKLGLVGPIDLDIRRDEQGVPVVLEVNARFGANSEHAPELLDLVLDDWAPAMEELATA
ncbi:ATP-grasp domain-containing protein [Pseudoclavibacter terrae]|uniref:ATP-grasp domain-containing protein n=1 Tax=Pseudoclavibacter terrae TaxID=1530195 RepID=A0A7J5B639_9MICO|nr:ATP-grasp domain-containing protein [Pseudoclavibacter terrae]KAB1639622.1 ATP-grasp domain-containing protein [Pseudoclavibacter terrae]